MAKWRKRGDDDDDDRIEFPEIRERRPPFWIEYLLVMFGGYVAGIASIVTCDHLRWILDRAVDCVSLVVHHCSHLMGH